MQGKRVAPDYLYVHASVKEQLIEALRHEIAEQYGNEPLQNENYVRIVSERHFERLCRFYKMVKSQSAVTISEIHYILNRQ